MAKKGRSRGGKTGAGPKPTLINTKDYAFNPAKVVIPAGATVRWVNRDEDS